MYVLIYMFSYVALLLCPMYDGLFIVAVTMLDVQCLMSVIVMK